MTDLHTTIQASFDRQTAMALIRAELGLVEKGKVEIEMPIWDGVLQQHGTVHGGVIGMIADSAAGYAAQTVAPETASVVTVEYKINMIAPAKGDRLIARGSIVRAGKTLVITRAEVVAVTDGKETACAVMQQTIMTLFERSEV